jgi:hypothetical protein
MTEKEFKSKAVEHRASTNGQTHITDHELSHMIAEVDKNTITDDDFQINLIKSIYKYFGWRYYSIEELQEMDATQIQKIINANYRNATIKGE